VREKGAVGGEEGIDGGGGGEGGEQFGLGPIEDNAEAAAAERKLSDIPRKVDEGKENGGVVKVGRGSTEGTEAVIVRKGEGKPSGSAMGERLVEFEKEDVEDEAGEDYAKGAALGETFVLGEGGERAVRGEVVAGVGRGVE
jgi:hypothetical protein